MINKKVKGGYCMYYAHTNQCEAPLVCGLWEGAEPLQSGLV